MKDVSGSSSSVLALLLELPIAECVLSERVDGSPEDEPASTGKAKSTVNGSGVVNSETLKLQKALTE